MKLSGLVIGQARALGRGIHHGIITVMVIAGMILGILPGITVAGTMVGTIPGITVMPATMAGTIPGTMAITAGAIPTTGQVAIHIIMAVVAVMPTSAQVLSAEMVPLMDIMVGQWQATAAAGTA